MACAMAGCPEFVVDLTARFGMCKCGEPKAAHASLHAENALGSATAQLRAARPSPLVELHPHGPSELADGPSRPDGGDRGRAEYCSPTRHAAGRRVAPAEGPSLASPTRNPAGRRLHAARARARVHTEFAQARGARWRGCRRLGGSPTGPAAGSPTRDGGGRRMGGSATLTAAAGRRVGPAVHGEAKEALEIEVRILGSKTK